MVEVALWMLSLMDNQDSYFLNLTLDGYIRDNNTLCGIAIRNCFISSIQIRATSLSHSPTSFVQGKH